MNSYMNYLTSKFALGDESVVIHGSITAYDNISHQSATGRCE